MKVMVSSSSSQTTPVKESAPKATSTVTAITTNTKRMTNNDDINHNHNHNHNKNETSMTKTMNSTKDLKKEQRKQKIKASIKDALAGAAAGAIAKTAVAPIERVKLLLQLRRSIVVQTNHPVSSTAAVAATANTSSTATATATVSSSKSSSAFKTNRNGNINVNTAWAVANRVYTEEGVLAFWRGNTPNVLRQGGAAALNFMLMDWYKIAISPIMKHSLLLPSDRPYHYRQKRRKLVSSFLSGGLAGGTTTTVLYPIEFLRTRLAMDIGLKSGRLYPHGMRDVFCSIWNTDGIRGLYQGYGIALTGVVLYRALHLGGYDACKTELLFRRQGDIGIVNGEAGGGGGGGDLGSNGASSDEGAVSLSFSERFAVAQIVSITAGTICYPIDSVRRRLMMQAGSPIKERLYRNSIHCFQRTFMEEGMRGFYLGIGPNLIRSFGGALLLVSYDYFKGVAC